MATEKRLIYADELEKCIRGISENLTRPGAVELSCLLQIADQPTVDAVEVVRCQDCIHWDECICKNPLGLMLCTQDSFCCYGERKDND